MGKVSTPGDYSTSIRHTGECAFQRAIILNGTSSVNGDEIEWMDIELPVDERINPRGKCIDLIGKDSEGNYVLCELKFRKKYSDNGSPSKAVEQLKNYYETIKGNVEELVKNNLHHTNAKSINWRKIAYGQTRLLIVANESYWKWWCQKKGEKLSDGSVEYYSLPVAENEFVLQKGKKENYVPQLPKDIKWIKL